MLQQLGRIVCWCISRSWWPTERLPDVMQDSVKVRPVAMLDAVQEIAIYIHRFHNLDLFQQGYASSSIFFFLIFIMNSYLVNRYAYFVLYRWYQIKITMRWEDNENMSFGIPARVVQYEGNFIKIILYYSCCLRELVYVLYSHISDQNLPIITIVDLSIYVLCFFFACYQ